MWSDLNTWGLAHTHLARDGWIIWRGWFDNSFMVFEFSNPLARYWCPSLASAKQLVNERLI